MLDPQRHQRVPPGGVNPYDVAWPPIPGEGSSSQTQVAQLSKQSSGELKRFPTATTISEVRDGPADSSVSGGDGPPITPL